MIRLRLCKCGCGNFVKGKNSLYLRGHHLKEVSLIGKAIPWNKGIPRTEKEKDNIRKGQTAEGRKRISESKKEQWKKGTYNTMYGETNPSKRPEVALKIGEANKGRVWKQESRLKLSESKKGHPGYSWTEENKNRQSDRMKINNPMKNEDTVERVSKTMKLFWENNPEGKIEVSKRMKGGRYRVELSEENKKIFSERMKINNPMFNPETAKKVSIRTIQDYKSGKRKSPHLSKYGRGKFSDGQTMLYEILDSMEVEYKKEYYLKAETVGCPNKSGIYLDSAIPNLKIDIEYDGYPYHKFLNVIEKDKIRDKWLKDQNWKILRIIGDEIQDTELVKNKIKDILNVQNNFHTKIQRKVCGI
jgi:hypothetical protein